MIRYPFDALKVNKAKEIATKQTERKFEKMVWVTGVTHLDMEYGMQK